MENLRSNYSEENPPTFGDLLRLVASGEALGFTVFSNDGGIGYTFSESVNDPCLPGLGETLLPMTSEEAQVMIKDLEEDGPEELQALGRLAIDTFQKLN